MLLVVAFALLAADDPTAPTAATTATTATTTGEASATDLKDDPTYAEAMRYYTNFEFEKASFRFRAATRNTDLSSSDRARAFVWLGLALAQAGDEPSAKEAFARGLRLDANIDLPPDAPPTIRPVFVEARAAPQDEVVVVDHHDAAPNADAAAAAPAQRRRPQVMALVGAGVAGGGLVVAGIGGVVGALALSQAAEAAKAPFQSDAIKAYDDAVGTATIGNGVLVVGTIIAVAGVATVIASPFFE